MEWAFVEWRYLIRLLTRTSAILHLTNDLECAHLSIVKRRLAPSDKPLGDTNMAKTRKPSITVRSVADNYAMANERIIEVSGDQGAGALISIAKAADGSLSIQVSSMTEKYRLASQMCQWARGLSQ